MVLFDDGPVGLVGCGHAQIDAVQVDQGQSEVLGAGLGDVLGGDHPVLHQVADQRGVFPRRVGLGLPRDGFGQQALADQLPGQTGQMDLRGDGDHGWETKSKTPRDEAGRGENR